MLVCAFDVDKQVFCGFDIQRSNLLLIYMTCFSVMIGKNELSPLGFQYMINKFGDSLDEPP